MWVTDEFPKVRLVEAAAREEGSPHGPLDAFNAEPYHRPNGEAKEVPKRSLAIIQA